MKKNKVLLDLIVGIILYILVFGTIGTIWADDKLNFCMGIILGGITAIILAIHSYITLDKALDMIPGKASMYVVAMYFVRMGINLIALVISFKAEGFSVIGCCIGILSLKVAAYLQPITNKFFRLN